jgi:hypothetical protein
VSSEVLYACLRVPMSDTKATNARVKMIREEARLHSLHCMQLPVVTCSD